MSTQSSFTRWFSFKTLLLVWTLLIESISHGGPPLDSQSVLLTATVQSSPQPQITVNFIPGTPDDTVTGYIVYKRPRGATAWGNPLATLDGTATGYTDDSVNVGVTYEYRVIKTTNVPIMVGPQTAEGYLLAGIELPLSQNRGKLVLLVDKSLLISSDVVSGLTRLETDLRGDGWTVMRHDVDRGPNPLIFDASSPDSLSGAQGNPSWAVENSQRVKEIKSIIKADYDSDPEHVKAVLLLGHIPVPYSGDYLVGPGGHAECGGALAADAFYADMMSPYGLGWTDFKADNITRADRLTALGVYSFPDRHINIPGDGKFDQNVPPGPAQLAIGRVDLYNMVAFHDASICAAEPAVSAKTEADLIAQYLQKDHDYRTGIRVVKQRVLHENGYQSWDSFVEMFGVDAPGTPNTAKTQRHINDELGYSPALYIWFPYLTGPDDDYLWADNYYAGYYDNDSGVGTPENFVHYPSKAVFTGLFASFLGDWDTPNDLMRCPLANAGYGLTCDYLETSPVQWNSRYIAPLILGEPMSSKEFAFLNDGVGTPQAHALYVSSLIGDPTLRLHNLPPPANLTVGAGDPISLSWDPSSGESDSGFVGYNIYGFPDSQGHYGYELLNTGGPIADHAYSATGASGYTEYMVRAVQLKQTASGSYFNASEGVFATVSESPPYIIAAPHGGNATVGMPFALTVAAAGTGPYTYQWLKGGTPISGQTDSSLILSSFQTSDIDDYSVLVTGPGGSVTTSSARPAGNHAPQAVNDSFNVIRNHSVDLPVLANDSDADNDALQVISLDPLSRPEAGTLSINSGGQAVHFVASRTFLGSVGFNYSITDGKDYNGAVVTLNVISDPANTAPVIGGISDQVITEDTAVEIPFTVSDDLTSPSDVVLSVTSSDTAVIPNQHLKLSGSGSQRLIQIRSAPQGTGTTTITISATDEDHATSSASFRATVVSSGGLRLIPRGFSEGAFQVVIRGPAGLSGELMKSSDLENWSQIAEFTLSGGNATYSDASASSADHLFYRFSTGSGCSKAIGFAKVSIPAGNSLISNPFDLDGFNSPADIFQVSPLDDTGAQPVAGTLNAFSVSTLNVSGGYDTVYYEWDFTANNTGGAITDGWSADGGGSAEAMLPNLPPGLGFFIYNGGYPMENVFMGTVPEGSLHNPLPSGVSLRSSIVPRAVSLDELGLQLSPGDKVSRYLGNGYLDYNYTSSGWSPSVPTIGIGEAVQITVGTAKDWIEDFSACSSATIATAPALSGFSFSADTFSFNASGPAGTYWNVYASTDLEQWQLVGGVILDAGGTAALSEPGQSGIAHHFYRLSRGGVCSKAAGFARVTIPAGNSLVSNPLDLDGVNNAANILRLAPLDDNGSQPAGTLNAFYIEIWNGSGYDSVYYESDFTANNTGGLITDGWSDGGQMGPATPPNLPPGLGFFINNAGYPTENVFMGTVPEGSLHNPLPSGVSLRSSIVPRAVSLDELGLQLSPGDKVSRYLGNGYLDYNYTSSGWSPSVPTIGIGEAVQITVGTAKDWIEDFSACQ